MSEPNEIVRASRQVIEKKLLTALGEGNSVAVLFTKQDLEDVIFAFEQHLSWTVGLNQRNRSENLLAGFRQLLREAFPK